jgi:geranylgeranyl reductase family protein
VSSNSTRVAGALVVGAGPAGCAAAVTLARRGVDVLVCDKATFPRDKCCGDGLTAGALRRIDSLGADPRSSPSWQEVDGVSVRSPSGRVARLALPARPGLYGAVCRRADLDAELVTAARRAGAEVLEGTAFTSLEQRPGALRVDLGGLEVETPYLVAADGIWSPVRHATLQEEEGYLGEWHAYRRYFEGVGAEAASHLWVWFDEPALPGYAWSFPLAGGRANVGVTLLREPGTTGRQLVGRCQEVLASAWCRSLLGRNARPEAPLRSWPIPTSTAATLNGAGGRVLFAGDAARLADPLTGEGVGQALESGIAAAEAILAGGAPQAVAATYEQSLAAGLRLDNRLASAVSRLLTTPRGARAVVRGAGLPFARDHVGAWLFEDYPRAFVLTPRRWRRGALSAPGAYAGRTT